MQGPAWQALLVLELESSRWSPYRAGVAISVYEYSNDQVAWLFSRSSITAMLDA